MARPRKQQTIEAGDVATLDAPPLHIEEAARVSVINRRLKHPFGAPSRGIPLSRRRSGAVVRFFTADNEHPDRHFVAIHEKGWQPCVPEDLAVKPESIGLSINEAGYVCRGTRGQDLLMWMPEQDWNALVRAKTDANNARVKAKAVREEVAGATAKEFGDEAGENVLKNFEQTASVGPIADE